MMMNAQPRPIFIGDIIQRQPKTEVEGGYVTLLGETFYCIRNYDAIAPFFISLTSSSNHWLFIATSGGLSAGRIDTENALFPYYTVDKITENSENTGSKALFLVTRGSRTRLWEPFSERYRNSYRVERNLYKNIPGTALVFEEINHDLDLSYRYAWRTSDAFGFVKTSWLANQGNGDCDIELADGLQNLLPANVRASPQTNLSTLLDAYKRSELEPGTGLGIFSLSATLSDLAEPSESLRATTVWHIGLDNAQYLLSSAQLDNIRSGQGAQQETDVKGQRGAYFVHATLKMEPEMERSWHLVADVNQDSAAVVGLIKDLDSDRASLCDRLERDMAANKKELEAIIASADGLQVTHDRLSTLHHFANVLFNVMRGGVFADQYWIDSADLREYVIDHNHALLVDHAGFFAALPTTIQVGALRERADASGLIDLVRLCYSYLPLMFSRRHGDPSRPWNRFAINVKKADGSRQFDYEGNWRDIFQNWEALAYSYPEFVEGMITTFLNATTADGYNPYRVTLRGIDWEVPEPENPWANIGYWSDHQVIYLQKLMEICAKVHPGTLETLLTRPIFSSANVPYRIKEYADLLQDPYNTIDFDWQLEGQIEAIVKARGTDGKLVLDSDGNVFHVTLAEKLLILLLAKLVNFVPEGGIWMNTQRPEWNDANNALVGKGLSVVTVCHLRRYMVFFIELVDQNTFDTLPITTEVRVLFEAVLATLAQHQTLLDGSFSDEQRRIVMDALGHAGSEYRWNYYRYGFSGEFVAVPTAQILAFLGLAEQYIEHALRANRREDGLYHAYNILHLDDKRASVGHLYEMLEGQVAILSSGLLTAEESLALLQTMRQSALYRADQHSYMLYPNRRLPGFLKKNCIDPEKVRDLSLVAALIEHKDRSLIVKDVNEVYHFSGHIRNAADIVQALAVLKQQPRYSDLVTAEAERILTLFEDVFHHTAFTGRSGTFFAYEGLGSIYWHMVSKLLLAAQETVVQAIRDDAPQNTVGGLIAAYFDIRLGIGFNKPPEVYGAFPTDPYSHTPEGQGAKQPGMTGMVKEEILTRMTELGLYIEQGKLIFDPVLVSIHELLATPSTFHYLDVNGQEQHIDLPSGSLTYTFCQTPIVLERSDEDRIVVKSSDKRVQEIAGNVLDSSLSKHILQRDGVVQQLTVFCRGLSG
ncbi:MAG: hypothetical protein ACYDBJ_12240 [Aggregatilineales bacterium]